MANRLVHALRTLWFMLAVAVSCIVLSIPVFIGIFLGQGDRAAAVSRSKSRAKMPFPSIS